MILLIVFLLNVFHYKPQRDEKSMEISQNQKSSHENIFQGIPKEEEIIPEPSPIEKKPEKIQEDNEFQHGESFEPEIETFSHDNYPHIEEMHWGKMPVTYTVNNPEVCGIKVFEQIKEAFETIEAETEGVVYFEKTEEDGEITINCFYSYIESSGITKKIGKIYADARITHIYNDTIGNVIARGEIRLYRIKIGRYFGVCEANSGTIIHEILHLFGFEDNENPRSIMYKYIVDNCNAKIDSEIIGKLKEMYFLSKE